MDFTEKLQSIIDYYGVEKQLDMVLEECSELQLAILKFKRSDKGEKEKEKVKDEIVDVTVMLNQLRLILDFSPIVMYRLMESKVNRQLERIQEYEQVQSLIEIEEDINESFEGCSECDGHDACEDFGCSIQLGIAIDTIPS